LILLKQGKMGRRRLVMVNQDVGFHFKQLAARISLIEDRVRKMDNKMDNEMKVSEDWDNSRLMREWCISKRTAANYRKKGLAYYKRGGRIYYSPESRENFINKPNEENHGTN